MNPMKLGRSADKSGHIRVINHELYVILYRIFLGVRRDKPSKRKIVLHSSRKATFREWAAGYLN